MTFIAASACSFEMPGFSLAMMVNHRLRRFSRSSHVGVITFFIIGPDSTLPMFMYSRMHRTVDPSINVVSTLLLAITLVFWVIAFAFAVRAAGRTRAADTLLGEAAA